MKKSILAIIICIMAGSSAEAQYYKSALGVRISSSDAIVNHSVSFKYFTGQTFALEGLFSFGDPVALGLLLQKHKPVLNGLTWFYGGGGYIGFASDKLIGLQGVLGLDYRFPYLPLNFSVDWKPELNLTGETAFEPAALGLTIRFVFR